MGYGRSGPQDVAGRSGAGRRLQARRISEARDPPHRQRQAADPPGRPAYRRGRLRQRAAAVEGAGGRSQRHRGDRRPAAQACGADLMAQLTDDCFAFSGPLLPLDDMERLIGERVAPVAGTERVELHAARGRVTAADVKAPVDLPPFDNSAVDGYAVHHADLQRDGDTRLAITGRLTAGTRAEIAIKP